MVGVVVVLMLLGFGNNWGPFAPDPFTISAKDPSPSIWQLLLSDRTTLGFARIGIGAVGLFVLASLAALAVTGRWINSMFGARTDPAVQKKKTKAMVDSATTIENLTREVQRGADRIAALQALIDQYEGAPRL
jgi:hypothetical protein